MPGPLSNPGIPLQSLATARLNHKKNRLGCQDLGLQALINYNLHKCLDNVIIHCFTFTKSVVTLCKQTARGYVSYNLTDSVKANK